MNGEQTRALINRIVQEVLYRVDMAEPKDEFVSGTTVLVTTHVPSKRSAIDEIKRHFTDISYVRFGGAGFDSVVETVVDADDTGEDAVMDMAASSECIVLLAPKLGLMERIAMGDDSGFVEQVVIRSLLWGRRVAVLLDFAPPRFKRNTFFEKVATTAQTLEDMGAVILTYKCASKEGAEGLSLVTEGDVTAAVRSGKTEIRCATGAIVTPAAKDAAREANIKIQI